MFPPPTLCHMSGIRCQVSGDMCQVSRVMCHVACVRCPVSGVMYYYFFYKVVVLTRIVKGRLVYTGDSFVCIQSLSDLAYRCTVRNSPTQYGLRYLLLNTWIFLWHKISWFSEILLLYKRRCKIPVRFNFAFTKFFIFEFYISDAKKS